MHNTILLKKFDYKSISLKRCSLLKYFWKEWYLHDNMCCVFYPQTKYAFSLNFLLWSIATYLLTPCRVEAQHFFFEVCWSIASSCFSSFWKLSDPFFFLPLLWKLALTRTHSHIHFPSYQLSYILGRSDICFYYGYQGYFWPRLSIYCCSLN